MNEVAPIDRPPAGGASAAFSRWLDRRFLWVSRHWLAMVNGFFFVYVGLPFLAPVLLANGFYGPANTIYSLYRAACHQFPSRAYFIFGEQVALCHRDIAIYATLLVGGLLFTLVRHRMKPIAFKWYLLFLIPIAFDGGTGLASELSAVVPMWILWALGLAAIAIILWVMKVQKSITWQGLLFLSFGPLALLTIHLFGPYHSDLLRRNLTGFIFGVGTVLFAYPYMDESFAEIHQDIRRRLANAG